jgi:hypothetical protein
MIRGFDMSPKGIKWRSFSDSPRSQGESQAYQAVGLTAQAMTAKELTFHITSVSNVNIDSSGALIGSQVPSLLYFVHPLLFTHFRGI